MTAAAAIYQRMGMDRLQRLAATESEHQDEAARVYVDRLADMERERRQQELPSHIGWHACSPGFGDGTGSSTVRREPLAEAYDRGEIINSAWHQHARRVMATLPERRLAALMLATLKASRPSEPGLKLSYDQMVASMPHFLQMLGWPPGAKALGWFRNGQAVKRQAFEARVELLMQAKAGVV